MSHFSIYAHNITSGPAVDVEINNLGRTVPASSILLLTEIEAGPSGPPNNYYEIVGNSEIYDHIDNDRLLLSIDGITPLTKSGSFDLISPVTIEQNSYVHPNHSGDVVSVGDGSTTIQQNVVTNDKLGNMSSQTIKGRNSAGLGDPEDLSPATVRSILNVADGANNYSHPNHSGDVTSAGDGATTISTDAVDNTKLANMATQTLKGRNAAGTGDPEDLSPTTVRTMLNVADGATNTPLTASAPADVTKSASVVGVSTDAARADHKHDVSTAAAGEITDATNAEGSATSLARSDHQHAHGNRGGGALHADFVGDSGAGGTAGFVPAPAAGDGAASKFLMADGTWDVPAGTGGDMFKSTYDPTNVSGDAFDADNHAYSNTASSLTATNTQSAIDELDGRIDSLELIDHAPMTLNAGATTQESANLSGQELELVASTTTTAGVMSAAQALKLDGIEAGANNYSHPNHSGDVTSVADGATTISNNAVTNVKAADMAQDTIKGRVSTGTGDPEDLTATQVRTLLNIEDGANNYSHPNHSGDVTSVGDGATTIVDDAVSNPKLSDMPANTLKGNDTGISADPKDLTASEVRALLNVADGANAYTHPNHTGDVTSVGDGTTTIANDVVSNAKLANMATDTIKGRDSAGTGDPEDLTPATVRAMLNVADGATNTPLATVAPVDVTKAAAVIGVSAEAAKADHKHDVSTAAAVELTDSTNGEGVSSSLARADHTHAHGNRGGGALHADFVGDSGSGGIAGFVPAPAAGDAAASKFLLADGTWAVPSGSGDMLKSTYDPTNVAGDAFDADNHVYSNATSGLTATNVQAALDEIDGNVDTNTTNISTNTADIAALTTGYNRREKVIDIVDSTAAPPTEVSGDRYILDTSGAPNAAWDGAAQNDIVEFNGTTWDAITPLEGYVAYVDNQNKDALFVDDGTPQWELRNIAASDTDGLPEGTTNLYNQTHTGEVTGATVLTISTDVVDNTNLTDMAQSTLKGRSSGSGTGDPEDLTAAQVRTILNVSDGANNYTHPNHTGDVTSVADGATTISANAVSNTKLADMPANTLKGNDTGGSADPQDLTAAEVRTLLNVSDGANNYSHPNHSGDVTSVGDGATTIVNNAVDNAKAADMSQDTIKGRVSAGTGDPEDLTVTQVRTLLNVADGANNYSHPNHTGDVTSSGDGATTISADVVDNTKLSNMAQDSLKGRVSTGTGDPEDLTAAQVRTLLNVTDGATKGVQTEDEGVLVDADAVTLDFVGAGVTVTDAGAGKSTVTIPGGGVSDAADLTYTPAVLTDWNGDADPGNADDALDQLAERVDDLELDSHAIYVHPNHTGDVTSVGDGATTIANNAVTNVKAADMPALTLKGNDTGSSADPKDLTVTQAQSLLNVSDGATKGIETQDEGTQVLAESTTLNFVGAGVVASDSGGGVTTVTYTAELSYKAGSVASGAFTGNPKQASVTFSTAFADANYSVVFTPVSTSNTTWSPAVVDGTKTASGFSVQMGSNSVSNLTELLWVALKHGETS